MLTIEHSLILLIPNGVFYPDVQMHGEVSHSLEILPLTLLVTHKKTGIYDGNKICTYIDDTYFDWCVTCTSFN